MNDLILRRAATFEPSTFDADKRTVQVVFSTGADVLRSDYEGQYIERLSMDPSAVNLAELRGAPVLDNHDRSSGVRAILGVVDEATTDGKRGLATLRFSSRPEVAGTIGDVQAGILRSVSAGYTVQQWQPSKGADGVRIRTATKWTPKEISFTAIPADAGAHVRHQPMELTDQVRQMAGLMGLPEEFSTRSFTTIQEARAAAVTALSSQSPTITNRQPQASVTRDADEGLVLRMADALTARIDRSHKPAADASEFCTYRISDIAKRCLELRGLSTLGSGAELITRAMHTTSDFAAVLQESYNKQLLVISMKPSPIQQIFKRAEMSDFRARHILEMSNGPALQKLNESGEIKFGTLADKELASYKLASYATGYNISFQALVSDDMSALSDLGTRATNGARQWFNGFLVDVILANPKLADNVAVFHASHGNLAGAGSVMSETSLAAGKTAMRLQTDLSGNPINISPKYVVMPAALETTFDKLAATLYPSQPSEAIVSARSLTPIVEPRLDLKGQTTAWYLFGDLADGSAVFEFAELSGYTGPMVETEQMFTHLGVSLRVVWHLGAGAVDSRGAWKNPGA